MSIVDLGIVVAQPIVEVIPFGTGTPLLKWRHFDTDDGVSTSSS
jgi:hypothetical protein